MLHALRLVGRPKLIGGSILTASLFATLGAAGCGTVMYRTGGFDPKDSAGGYIYGATKADVMIAKRMTATKSGGWFSRTDWEILLLPLLVLDLPLSVISDTLALPWDVFRNHRAQSQGDDGKSEDYR